jgi:hypothetical protein
LNEFDLFSLLLSIRGLSYIIGTGIIGIQHKVIRDQKDRIDIYENNILTMEDLLRDLLEKQDTPQKTKKLIKEAIRKIESGK